MSRTPLWLPPIWWLEMAIWFRTSWDLSFAYDIVWHSTIGMPGLEPWHRALWSWSNVTRILHPDFSCCDLLEPWHFELVVHLWPWMVASFDPGAWMYDGKSSDQWTLTIMALSGATLTSDQWPRVTRQVPSTSSPGDYRLRLEGDHQGSVGGTVFVNETRLQFAQRFLTVLIQTSRPLYTFNQHGELPELLVWWYGQCKASLPPMIDNDDFRNYLALWSCPFSSCPTRISSNVK